MKRVLLFFLLLNLAGGVMQGQKDAGLAANPEDGISGGNATPENAGTAWRCGQTFTDTRDGRIYNTIPIVNQCWFRENLNYGTWINPDVVPSNNGIVEKYCYASADFNCDSYGGLYTYEEAMQYNFVTGAQGACPGGWHVSREEDFFQFNNYLFLGNEVLGGVMKEQGTAHWNAPNTGATNQYGFTALGTGYYYPWGWPQINYFWEIKDETSFWCSKDISYGGVYRSLENTSGNFYGGIVNVSMHMGYSVRCVRDLPVNSQVIQNVEIVGTRCYNAIDTISTAGGSTFFRVPTFTGATLVAGGLIRMLPGTQVFPSATFHAYVTTNNQYCSSFTKSASGPNSCDRPSEPAGILENAVFSVFPNPADDHVTIAVEGGIPYQQIQLYLFNNLGNRVMQECWGMTNEHDLSLKEIPQGVYILKITDGRTITVFKVIRK